MFSFFLLLPSCPSSFGGDLGQGVAEKAPERQVTQKHQEEAQGRMRKAESAAHASGGLLLRVVHAFDGAERVTWAPEGCLKHFFYLLSPPSTSSASQQMSHERVNPAAQGEMV